jgi:hypothetical protein
MAVVFVFVAWVQLFVFGFFVRLQRVCLKTKTMCCKGSDYKNSDIKTECTTTLQQLRWPSCPACCG